MLAECNSLLTKFSIPGTISASVKSNTLLELTHNSSFDDSSNHYWTRRALFSFAVKFGLADATTDKIDTLHPSNIDKKLPPSLIAIVALGLK